MTITRGVTQVLIMLTIASLILLGLVLPKLQAGFASDESGSASSDLASEITRDLAAIPLYSNAKAITSKVPGSGPNEVDLETTDSVEAVISFYDSELKSQGWTFYRRWSEASVEYMKMIGNDAPYTPHVFISVDPYGIADDAPKRISIEVVRYPNPNHMPLYHNPRNVQTHDHVTQGAAGAVIDERMITYETDAPVQDVLAAYRSSLPLFGWLVDQRASSSQSYALTYYFKVEGGDFVAEAAYVVISASEQAGGPIQVELRITGNMLVPTTP